MDHDRAVQIKAAERYYLGELPGDDRDAFEEHFFVCEECADEVRTLAIFTANAKAVFREQSAPPGKLIGSQMFWISAVLNCALVIGLGYTFLHLNPQMRQELAEARAPQFVQDVPVLAEARGGETVREIASGTQRIVFSFYMREEFRSVSYDLKDEAGKSLAHNTLPSPPREDSGETHLSIATAGLKPGLYEIRFSGEATTGETPVGESKFRISAGKQPDSK